MKKFTFGKENTSDLHLYMRSSQELNQNKNEIQQLDLNRNYYTNPPYSNLYSAANKHQFKPPTINNHEQIRRNTYPSIPNNNQISQSQQNIKEKIIADKLRLK